MHQARHTHRSHLPRILVALAAALALCCLIVLPGCGPDDAAGSAAGSEPADAAIAAGSSADSGAAGAEADDAADTGSAAATAAVDRGTAYYDVEHVVLYLDAYGELPPQYITSDEARDLGWEGGAVEPYQPGAAIGGNHFGNYEGILPQGDYHECDIDTQGARRGAKRLVWSVDGHYYYTEDHYASFVEVIPDGDTVTYGETFD